MLDLFKDFLRSIGLEGNDARISPERDPRVAAAAILCHVAEADGMAGPAELESLRRALAAEFGLSDREAARIADAGREADAEAVDLFRFTSVLARAFDERERARFVGLLWQVAYADGRVHELEDNTVWRVAELLGVSARDRMLMKREAAERSGTAAPALEAEP